VVVVNLDPYFTQSGWIEFPLEEFGLDPQQPYQMHDMLGDGRFLWQGYRNYVEIDPHALPAHIFHIRRKLRTERDFDYFM
jgi:starch synthase (maltosyl-transferring)